MMTKTLMASLTTLALTVVLTGEVAALPSVGRVVPAARIADADGHAIDIRALGNKPVLVLYEDKDSATTNAAFKADLSRLAKGDKYKTSIALVPVADVSSYDFWPVKGFVKDSIRSESKKVGATIYCDFSGSFRNALGLQRGVASVVLVARDGKVLFAKQGAMDTAERARVIDMLRAEVDAR
jgi:hypothetical protein